MDEKQESLKLLRLIFNDDKLKYFKEYDIEENKIYIKTIGRDFLQYIIKKIKTNNNTKASDNIKIYNKKYNDNIHTIFGFILVVCDKHLLEYSGEGVCQLILDNNPEDRPNDN